MSSRRFPFLEHDGPIAMAHRGEALHPENIGYENSMRAFAHAVELGYRYLETDVHATSDGAVVAFRDRNLDRVTDRAGAVAALPGRGVEGADQRPRTDPAARGRARPLARRLG